MTKDVIQAVAAGMIGRFWPVVDGKPEAPEIHGAIRRDDDGYWQVDLEGWRTAQNGEGPDRGIPDTLVGVLGGATVLLSDKRRWRDFDSWSGQRIHVVRIRYETLVTEVDVNFVEAAGIVSAEAVFPSQMRWASYDLPQWRPFSESDPVGEGRRLDIAKYPQTEHDVGDGMTLRVKPALRLEQEFDHFRVPFGLSLTLLADQPRPTAEFVRTLELFQDLISLCWGGRVPCAPGEGRVLRQQDWPGRFSSRRLLEEQPAGAADLSGLPAVHLQDLGGPEAFARWLGVCRDNSRVTRAVSEGLYVGASTEVRLLNTATAIEYWIGKNRRAAEWARLTQENKENELRRLVMHQLPLFERWLGDGERFSARLWWDYNSLKHDPSHDVDYSVISVFGHAARLMLIGSLLDVVAGSTIPSERMAAHYWAFGEETKKLLEEPGRTDVPEESYRRRRKRKTPDPGA